MVNQPDDPNQAQAWISGTPPDQTIDFYIPRGNTGPRGPVGPIGPSLAVGSVATVTGPAAPGTVGATGLTGPKGDPGGLVLGTLITGPADLNDYKTPGSYRIITTTSISNIPAAFVGTLTVWQNNNATPMFWQEYTPVTSGGAQLFWRRAFGPSQVWGQWRVYASTRVDQTAGRVIYQWDDINLREQIIYGDTGVRQITADNGYVGNLYIRRQGYRVTLFGAIQCPPGGSLNGTFLTLLPDGFRPYSTIWTYFAVRHSATGNYFTLFRKQNELAFEGATGFTDGAQVRFEISWDTNNAWPTTLPGTASGTLPNT
ncbi:hypothetical protein SEA_BREYLOR17_23 [Arthrobacter phage Breylor17]|uniref:Minor tail protein n=1 Tax=Arthrobacter phage Breylor17 TaxID=2250409 RepID=A0A345KL66_9CAUD|nr:hypothetical protein QCN34_gp23 [Arthrobacter phage Breylor17]AXH43768.1 hypothetical protein SEA_BREYLOR17_23 [Arthrobacter phage Breylor17]